MAFRFEIESAGAIVDAVDGIVGPDLDEAVRQARLWLSFFPDADQLTVFEGDRRVAVIDEAERVTAPA